MIEEDKAITVLNALVLVFWTDTKLSIEDYNAFLILTKLEYQAELIKEESTSELLRFSIRHFSAFHKETNGKIWPVWKSYQLLVKKNIMSIAQVVNVVDIAIHKLPHMETLYKQVKDG